MLQRNWRCGCGFSAAVPVQRLGEVATCPKCRAQAVITMKNTQPIAMETSASGAMVPVQEHCSRCGRKFRGDWDRHGRGDDAVCDICARQAGNEPVAAVQSPKPGHEFPAPVAGASDVISSDDWHDMYAHLRERTLTSETPRRWRGHVKLFGSILLTAALVAGAIACLVYFIPETVDSYQDGGLRGLTLVLVEHFFWGAIITFLSLYSVCWLLGRLPNDDVWANVLSIGMVSVWLGVLSMIGVNGYLSMASWVVSILLLKFLYDFAFQEFLLYCVVSTLMNSALLVATGLLEYAARH